MANIYRTSDQVTQDMLDDYKAITGIELVATDLGREEVIKIKSFSIVISSLRANMQRVLDDFFPQSASTEGLVRHLAARQLPDRFDAQKSNGVVQFTVTGAVTIPALTIFTKDIDGKVYRTNQEVTAIGAGLITVTAESFDVGQSQNIEVDSGVAFTLQTAINNVEDALINVAQFRDGRDQETPDEMLERIETHDRRRDTGGNLVAYERFAREASAQVVTAKALDEPRGPGTADVVITSGTTDIRKAVENSEAITRLPSAALVLLVQDYIRSQNPVTDDTIVLIPTEDAFDVTFTFDMINEALRSSTQVEIEKEIKIFIYSAGPTDILQPTELERLIDARVGHLIKARRVSDFPGAGPSFVVPDTKILIPGTLTFASF